MRGCRYPSYAWRARPDAHGKSWHASKDILAIKHAKDRSDQQPWDEELNLVFSNNFFADQRMVLIMPKSLNTDWTVYP